MATKIEWTGETWNPITGCTKISEGCRNCYAERMANRLKGRFGYPQTDPFQPGIIHDDKLCQPFKWKKSRQIFVCSMGDLFHEVVELSAIQAVFNVMKSCPEHIFQVLTKRPERMLMFAAMVEWPDNVWAGVSIENSHPVVMERLRFLEKVPAPVRFISVEPMIGSVHFGYHLSFFDWVICGAETGKKSRPCHLEWVCGLRDECVAADVSFFFKKFADGTRKVEGQMWQQTPANKRFQGTRAPVPLSK